MRYIKFNPKIPCMICGEIPHLQEEYLIGNDGNNFLCNDCDGGYRRQQSKAKKDAFNSFVGDIDVQKILMELIQETQNEITKYQTELSCLAFLNMSIDEPFCLSSLRHQCNTFMINAKLADLYPRLKRLKSNLLMLSPALHSDEKAYMDNFEAMKESAKEYSVIDILDNYGAVKTGRISGGTQYKCPFHEEKTGSFVAYKTKNNAHCFGCGFHGDNIAVYMKLYDKTFLETIKELSCV